MKKSIVIVSMISCCILLFSCEKIEVESNDLNTNDLDLNLGGVGWCKSAIKPGKSTAHTNQQNDTMEVLLPEAKTPKK